MKAFVQSSHQRFHRVEVSLACENVAINGVVGVVDPIETGLVSIGLNRAVESEDQGDDCNDEADVGEHDDSFQSS